ncbi:hypothetical protein [Reyranella sp.]|uniref:hypothetical protein n=1 Tax=Reyranella sp. TaxID=1929291 RepID=UPI003BAA27A7
MRWPGWMGAAVVLTAGWSVAAQDPTLQWSSPSAGSINGSKATIDDRPCCGATTDAVPVPDSDAAVVAGLPGKAARDGRVLSLSLAGGRTLRLIDCDEASGCTADDTRLHRLVDWWPDHRLYVVAVGLYEESVAYLVSERDGAALVTTAPPVLSPSRRQAVALVSNLISGVDLEIVDLVHEPPSLAKVTPLPDCGGAGPEAFLRPRPVWLDDRTVTFEGEPPLPAARPDTRQVLRVEGGRAHWQC